MTKPVASSSSALAASQKYLPLLLLLFVGSGCSALIYEVVWLQLLQLVIGLTGISLGILLGTFMGGMFLGSLLLSRLVSSRRHPLRVYAMLELGIGLIAIVVLHAVPWVGQVYTSWSGHGFASLVLRGLVSAVCLLPPTLLMGATLPAIARWVETSREGVSWLGFFYGGNIAGAVFGCLLAGFYLLRVHDMAYATYIAAAINGSVALVALILSSVASGSAVAESASDQAPAELVPGAWAVYVSIALSGLTALGAEVIWTRLLSLLLGGTVYTFSNVLAIFLLGLGLGSSAGAYVARATRSPRIALGLCQSLLVLAVAWTAFMLSKSIPFWPIDPTLSMSPWYTFQLDLARCLVAILPAAILWGASFPLALAAVAGRGQDPGRLVGGVYAANTVGAILGSLLFSMVLVPMPAIGTTGCERILIVLAAVSAFLALGPLVWSAAKHGSEQAAPTLAGGLAALILAAGFTVFTVTPAPWGMYAYGRMMATWKGQLAPGIIDEKDVPGGSGYPDVFCTFVGEGMNVSVCVTKNKAGIRSFHGAGKVQASTDPRDMRLQRMLGHISALADKQDPKSVLVVACGAGVTAGTFVLYPTITNITICDIEPMVPTQVTPRFGKENYFVVGGTDDNGKYVPQPDRVHVEYDDGRHFIRTTKQKFDIITSDPIDPWVKGCAALNTVEYYQFCKDHLNPGGVVSLWIPLYESNTATIKSVIATFLKVFPKGIIWSNDSKGEGYDIVLFGQVDGTEMNVDQLAERLDSPAYAKVRDSLSDVGFGSKEAKSGQSVGADVAEDLLATYAGDGENLHEWQADGQINTDANLRLQYLAGMSLNNYKSEEILYDILHHYRFPDKIITGSAERLEAVKAQLESSGRPRTPSAAFATQKE